MFTERLSFISEMDNKYFVVDITVSVKESSITELQWYRNNLTGTSSSYNESVSHNHNKKEAENVLFDWCGIEATHSNNV